MPIKLQSKDKETFEVDMEVAKKSATIKNMLEDLSISDDSNEVVPLPNVESAILKKGSFLNFWSKIFKLFVC